MAAIIAILRPLTWLNTMLLRIGRNIAWVAMGLMVLIIVLQVVFRYVLNDALSWSEEAARGGHGWAGIGAAEDSPRP